MTATPLRRFIVVAVVAALASPAAGSPPSKKAKTTVARSSDAAALQATLLAVQERLYGLQQTNGGQQAEINELRAQLNALRPNQAQRRTAALATGRAGVERGAGVASRSRDGAALAASGDGAALAGSGDGAAGAGSGNGAATVSDKSSAAPPPGTQVAMRSAPTDASVQSVYQQQNALFRRKLTFTPSLTRTYSDNRFFTLNGFLALGAIFLGNVNVTQQRSDISLLGLNATYGLSDRVLVEGQVPYFSRSTTYASVGANDSTQLASQDSVRSNGIGDVLVGGYYQLNRETATSPGLTLNGHVSLPTGRSPYGIKLISDKTNSNLQYPGSLPTGSGALGYQIGASFVKTSDPAIFFGGANVYFNQPAHFGDLSTDAKVKQPGFAQSGNAFQYQLGTAFALNEKTSLSFAFDDIVTTEAKLHPDGSALQNVVGSGTNAAYLSISAGYARNPKQTVITEFDLGLTHDAPNFQLNMRFPHTF